MVLLLIQKSIRKYTTMSDVNISQQLQLKKYHWWNKTKLIDE